MASHHHNQDPDFSLWLHVGLSFVAVGALTGVVYIVGTILLEVLR